MTKQLKSTCDFAAEARDWARQIETVAYKQKNMFVNLKARQIESVAYKQQICYLKARQIETVAYKQKIY
jgi:hypothetical protein